MKSATDPELTEEELYNFAATDPAEVLENPALPLLLLSSPAQAFDIIGRARHYVAENEIRKLTEYGCKEEAVLTDALLLEHLEEIPAMFKFDGPKPDEWDAWLDLMKTAKYGEEKDGASPCFEMHSRILQIRCDYLQGFGFSYRPFYVPQWLIQAHRWYLTGSNDRYRSANLVAETARDLAKGIILPPHIKYLGSYTSGQMARAKMTEKLLSRVRKQCQSMHGLRCTGTGHVRSIQPNR